MVRLYRWSWSIGAGERAGWSLSDQRDAQGYVLLAPGKRIRVPDPCEVEEVIASGIDDLTSDLLEVRHLRVPGVRRTASRVLGRDVWTTAPLEEIADVIDGEQPIAWLRVALEQP